MFAFFLIVFTQYFISSGSEAPSDNESDMDQDKDNVSNKFIIKFFKMISFTN